MMRAIDTNVLVYLAASDVPQHSQTKGYLEEFLSRSPENRIAVTDDVLLEFVHVVTDPKRLKRPSAPVALDLHANPRAAPGPRAFMEAPAGHHARGGPRRERGTRAPDRKHCRFPVVPLLAPP